MSGPTPGPWATEAFVEIFATTGDERDYGGIVLGDDGVTVVAQCVAARDMLLIAAAPEMLEALEWIAANYENVHINHVDFRVEAKHRADAAIAKATKP